MLTFISQIRLAESGKDKSEVGVSREKLIIESNKTIAVFYLAKFTLVIPLISSFQANVPILCSNLLDS